MSRIIVASHRLPSTASDSEVDRPVMALKAAILKSGGLWFGWSGGVNENVDQKPTVSCVEGFSLATLDLSKDEYEGYAEGFCGQALWPLLHGHLELCRLDGEAYRTYRQVNRRFASVLCSLVEPGDMLWIHDYHFIPLGDELRGLGVTAPIGFFLHTPFPQTEIIAALPWHRELLSDFCAYDVVGFQTSTCAENFRKAVAHCLGGSVQSNGRVMVDNRVVAVDAFPVGIDTRATKEMSRSASVGRLCEHLRDCMGGREWICAVDPLDYTKGIAERFRAFETLLEGTPALHDRISLVQIAAPPRESVAQYQEMECELESLSGRINGLFGTFDWTPIQYLRRALCRKELAALYRVSRVGLITPLRDGMNLVAKEYVAAQDPEDPGVLILSRFAGAAHELKQALIVNPYDTDAVARSLLRSLQMPLAERRDRWKSMMCQIEANDVHHWHRGFVERLAARDDLDTPRKVA